MKDVFSWSISSIFILLYLEKASMKLSNWGPANKSTNWSMRGKGQLSLRQSLFKSVKSRHILHLPLGMATGRVRAGFFHTRTRPAGQDPWPGPAPFRVPGFFSGPRPAPAGPRGPHGPRLEIGPNLWPNQKKKSPDLFFPTFKPAYLNSSLDNVAQMPNHRLLIINK